ncbi:hypothetical protein [Dechloromonas agitata]|nr:hypothetical protein [Dechloromonas agitata]
MKSRPTSNWAYFLTEEGALAKLVLDHKQLSDEGMAKLSQFA